MNVKVFFIFIGLIFAVSFQSVAEGRSWEVFNSPRINEYASRLKRENLDLQIEAAKLQELKAYSGISKSAWGPDFSLIGSVKRGNLNAMTEASVARIGVQATWPLDIFGDVRNQVKAANLQMDAQAASMRYTENHLVQSLVIAMIRWNNTTRIRQLVDAQLQVLELQIRLQSDLVRAGLSTPLALRQLKALKENTAVKCPQLEAQISSDIYLIDQLMGAKNSQVLMDLQDATPVVLALPVFSDVLEAPLSVLQGRPDVQKARATLEAFNASLAAVESQLWPKVSLNSFYAQQDTTLGALPQGDQVWSVGADLTYPLFNFGRLRNQIQVADSKSLQAAMTYELALKKAFQEAHTALRLYEHEMDTLGFLQRSTQFRQEALGLAQDQYDAGLINFMALAPVKIEAIQAQISEIQQASAVAIAYIQLQTALAHE